MQLPPILTTTEQVAEFAWDVSGCPILAVDLEADSLHCYQEKVCLLQFSTPERTVLIDPLDGADLAPLKPLLSDPAIRKIFHAADYDIRCLSRDFDIRIDGLFDTMISCQFLGEERIGLADILQKFYSLELDKQYQRADWARRPLPDGMVCYAAEDTRHLHRLAADLEQRLRDKGRLDWVQEECALLEQVRFAERSGPQFLHFKGAGTLNRRQLAALEKLLSWRDQEARRRDCPLFKVVGNKELLALARALPQSRHQLDKVGGFSPRIGKRYGQQLLAALNQATELSEDRLPVYPKGQRKERDPELEKHLKTLKKWRQEQARRLELDPGVLINNALLETLAEQRPRTSDELVCISGLKSWQRHELGDGILKALQTLS